MAEETVTDVDVPTKALPPRFGGRWTKPCNVLRTLKAIKRRRELCAAGNDGNHDEPCRKQKATVQMCDGIGRRAVHLRCLAEGLSQCKNPVCKQPLVLADTTRELRYGLGSVLEVPCRSCSFVNKVDTDTRICNTSPGPKPFSSNVKAAAGNPIYLFWESVRVRVCGERDSAVALALLQVVNFYIHTYFEADFLALRQYSFI